jgi:peptidoglycan/xylan/chitin deacetylase (PgdA/CDA1 family)
MSHRDLRSLPGAELQRELAGAAEVLEQKTGKRPQELAYPYGFESTQVVTAARQHYERACTVEFRRPRATEDPLRLPRLDAYYFQAPGTLEAWGTWRFDAYCTLRRAGRGVRGVLERVGILR